MLGLAIVSAIRSLEPRQAIIEITIFTALGYLTLFTARLYKAAPEIFIKKLTYTILAGAVLYMVSFYVGYATAIAVGKQLTWPYPFFGFSNIRLFQQYQLWGIGLICLPLLTFDLSAKQHRALYAALTLWWVLLFYAASRGVTLGWILAMLATAAFYRKSAWQFLRIQLISALGGLIGYLLLFKAIPAWLASASSTATQAIVTSTIFRDTTYDRLDLWKAAYVMIKNFPILGVGPMQFYFYTPFGTHPHNSVLQFAAEWGLPATLIILAMLAYAAKCWLKQFGPTGLANKSEADKQLAIVLFFTMIANGAYSLVEGVIVMPISQILMFTMIGLMIGQYTSGSRYPAKPERLGKFRFRPIVAGITLLFLTLSVMPELMMGLTSYQRYYAPGDRAFAMAPDTINPRIWMQQRRVEPSANKPAENKKDIN